MAHKLPEAFSKNRSEESPIDNFTDYVVPPFLESLGIEKQTKALVIAGGRGCGKTALVRYFCHATQLSPKRQALEQDDLGYIGLYWRADTNFLNSFVGGGQDEKVWRAAFEHLVACEVGIELIRSLHNINCSKERKETFGGLERLSFDSLSPFGAFSRRDLEGVERTLIEGPRVVSSWINNIDAFEKPIFLPAQHFLTTLIATLQEQLPYLKNTVFAVFVDEYENLRDEQQKLINGLLKHGKPPLLYNIAMKRNGFHTYTTLGTEHIQDISDYRVIDLETEMEPDFSLFAAELIFFRLAQSFPEMKKRLPISCEILRSRERVDDRYKSASYRDAVLGDARKMLPRTTEKEAAKLILHDNRLRTRLLDSIKGALKERKRADIDESQFVASEFPEASVLMPALLSRPREDVDKLHAEFAALKAGENNRLASGDLIDNNLFGCVNKIYLDAKKNSILFSGYDTLLLLAKGNTRHLIELVHRIFRAADDQPTDSLPVITPEKQAEEIRAASESILGSVKGFGSKGPQLYALSICLGSIFREKHRSVRQSEPETNHFTVSSGNLTNKLSACMSEAEKWSILYTTTQTKLKNVGVIGEDFILNPIFAPCFQISYRKKRSLQLSAQQLMQMFEGDQKQRDTLVRSLAFDNGNEADQASLFDRGN